MRKVRLRRPSPALVVSTLALVVALGGTSYAALKIGTKDIKNGAVTTAKLHNGAVTNKKIANHAISGSKINLATLGTVPNANRLGGVAASGYQKTIPVGEWAGSVGTIPTSSGTVFAGPTTTVSTNATQNIVASGSAALGTSAGTASIDVSICKQPASGGALTFLNPTTGDALENVTATTTRIPFAISASGSPGTGSWRVGVCVNNNSASQTINNTDWSIGWALVI